MVLVKNGWPWKEAWGGQPPSRISEPMLWAAWMFYDIMGSNGQVEYDERTLERRVKKADL